VGERLIRGSSQHGVVQRVLGVPPVFRSALRSRSLLSLLARFGPLLGSHPLSYGKPDISAAEATRPGREEIECSTVPGQSRRSIICGTVEGRAGIDWRGPEI
jgi:hypothetical protein